MKNITNTPEEKGAEILASLYEIGWRSYRSGAVRILKDNHGNTVGRYLGRRQMLEDIVKLMR